MSARRNRFFWNTRFLRAALPAALLLALMNPAAPQTFDGSAIGLQQLLQQQQTGNIDQVPQAQSGPAIQTYRPQSDSSQPSPVSALERIYSDRVGHKISQFGYDVLGGGATIQVAQAGGIQDNYVLGVGDQVVVVLRGPENATYSQRVNRLGQVVLPRLPPVAAAGRTFGDFRSDIEARVAQAFVSTQAFVSLGEVRQVSVLVSGAVRNPGSRIISALASPLDAILLSGGITKAGSLRGIVIEGGGRSRTVDLYGVLSHAGTKSLGTLVDGDRIFVPPLGKTVAISGGVRSAGIFEIPRGANSITASQLVDLAGGLLLGGGARFSQLRLEASGQGRVVPATENTSLHEGEILFVDPVIRSSSGRVSLRGALQVVGDHALGAVEKLSQVLRREDLSEDAYPMFSAVVRRDPDSNARVVLAVSLESLFTGKADMPLRDDDVVYVFSHDEIRLLTKAASGQALTYAEIGCSIPSQVSAAALVNSQSLTAGQRQPNAVGRGEIDLSCPEPNLAAQLGLLGPQLGFTPTPIPSSPPTNAQTQTQTQTSVAIPGARLPAPSPSANAYAGQPYVMTPFSGGELSSYSNSIYSSFASGLYGDDSLPPDNRMTYQRGGSRRLPTLRGMADRLEVSPETVIRTARDHLVWVVDSVRDPGPYLSAEGSTLGSLIKAAGGVLREADLSSVEVTSTQIDQSTGTSRTIRAAYKGREEDFVRVALRPLDVVRVRSVFSDGVNGRISIAGEVRYPGTFDIVRGERLSTILERAGGLTVEAYPYGAVFTRQRAAEDERTGNARLAKQLENDFATLLSMPSVSAAAQGASGYVSNLAQQLRAAPALGRITATVDPSILRTHPELDIIVEPGDTLFIPRRPTTVTVSGEVLNPGSFQYRAEFDMQDYLKQSGGTTQAADDGRVFIVLPDGTARPVSSGWFAVNSAQVAPGSSIIVPRDLRPFDATQFLKDFTQITSQLAVSAASLAVIGR